MSTKANMLGRRFGEWTVAEESEKRSVSGAAYWLCECSCGMKKEVLGSSLRKGASKSCNTCRKPIISNTYVFCKDGTVRVFCANNASFLIDIADFAFVSRHQWWVDAKGYAKTKIKGAGFLLARLLMGVTDSGRDVFVDHISGLPTDNRRRNLRICKPQDNIKNRKLNANNSTGYKGVSFHRKLKKYMAGICAGNGKTVYLGCYPTAREAAQVYDKAALLLHGEFARTNAMLGLLEVANENSQAI